MFTCGGVEDPSIETTGLVENIVRSQLIEMITRCNEMVIRRGARSFDIVDLFFLIRHNRAKLGRLRNFLTWKEVRRNTKESDGQDGADFADFNPLAEGPISSNIPVSGATPLKAKGATTTLPWDISSYYNVQIPGLSIEIDDDEKGTDPSALQRLVMADERTRDMTKDEYITWSECRHASFTFRRGKRFRDWVGFGTITDYKPNDDFIDALGFLGLDIVRVLVGEALKVKDREGRTIRREAENSDSSYPSVAQTRSPLFEAGSNNRQSISVEPRDVQEAFQRLQNTQNRVMATFLANGKVPNRFPPQLI